MVVIVHFHQFCCGHSVVRLNKRAVQRIVQVRQVRSVRAKAEKVKSVNKTGISADQCRILMNVTSNLSDLIPLSE